MTAWKRLLECEGAFVWVQGEGPKAPAVISKRTPSSTDKAVPLYTLMSQLDPTEWSPVPEDDQDK